MQTLSYQQILDKELALAQQLKVKHHQISNWRGFVMFLVLLVLAFAIYGKRPWLYLIAAGLFLGFCLLMRVHLQIAKAQDYNASQITLCQSYLSRQSNLWRQADTTGSHYLSADYSAGKDLDIFGASSLYQYICAAHTPMGQKHLADLLTVRTPDLTASQTRQQAVAELMANPDLTWEIQILSHLSQQQRGKVRHQDALKNFSLAMANNPKPKPIWQGLMWLLPAYTLTLLGVVIIGIDQGLAFYLMLAGVFLQYALGALNHRRNQESLRVIYGFCQNLEAYQKLFAKLEQASFSSDYLQKLQAKLTKPHSVSQGLKKLQSLNEKVELRYNGLAYLLCNAFLMWDFHCVRQFANWQQTYGKEVDSWFQSLGEIEALISLQVIAQVKSNYCLPELVPHQQPILDLQKLAHPLLLEEQAKANSLSLEGQTCILTGSNMSGKTTFLRSIGLNAILAYAGGVVNAESCRLSQMALFTSIRVEDSVSQGISTFYGELLRIKQMVEYSKESLPMLALIDEIFRGTNSLDRITGATAALEKLSNPWGITMVSTHDFELCALVESGKIMGTNYHFTEYYQDNQICFDYQLRPGRCQTTNAKHLLRLAGIMD